MGVKTSAAATISSGGVILKFSTDRPTDRLTDRQTFGPIESPYRSLNIGGLIIYGSTFFMGKTCVWVKENFF